MSDGEALYDVVLGSKMPHDTVWVMLVGPVEPGPILSQLIDELARFDWKPDRFPAPPPLDGRKEYTFVKNGSGLFGGWTPAEHQSNLRQVRRILGRYGITGRRVRYSIADLM